MLKETKPGRYYILVNLDEPYAADVYEVLKFGQQKKDEWPEGDIGFLTWVSQTWGADSFAYKAASASFRRIGPLVPREHYSLIARLKARLEAAEKERDTLRLTNAELGIQAVEARAEVRRKGGEDA